MDQAKIEVIEKICWFMGVGRITCLMTDSHLNTPDIKWLGVWPSDLDK